MVKAVKYNTKQREIIFDYLKQNRHSHVTAEDIFEHLKKEGRAVGKSTVYRYLDSLTQSGEVRKYFSNDGKTAQYQIADNCDSHYHLKCSDCGRIIHTDCDEIAEVFSHILSEHSFAVDMKKTVIYGKCDKCI
ncbi:MAG: transcriptional repressor [Clostridia bacterium]|nr:transcriptional repressor [Clostridia bacterium]